MRPGLLGSLENKTTADEVRLLREKKGLTQAELAGLLHQCQAWLSKRETGAVLFSRAEVQKVFAVLHGLDDRKAAGR